jgi:uncharacterized protein YdeI (YjbR/CyaY-like superfamily)
VRFFSRREELRDWFEQNHARESELWIGYHKKETRKAGVTYPAALEEALCYGWIDGQVRSFGEDGYTNRYTPRKPGSRWSSTNVAKVEELSRAGRMRPAGIRAFESRDPSQPKGYSVKEQSEALDRGLLKEFKSSERAWHFFESQPPSYRRITTFWVMSARQEETRRRRLHVLIEESERGERVNLLSPGSSRKK